MEEWIEKIKGVAESYVHAVIADAADVGLPSTDIDFYVGFLLDRRRRLSDIVKQNQASFPKVHPTLWGYLEPEDYQI
ncbi:MAG: hypothetical protein ACJ8FY_02860 [Gemmataceae bacterium]